MSYIVALTGGIGSGKSTVANAFSRLGVPVIDADVIARQVVKPGSEALDTICHRFGSSILMPDGSLNRQKLRETIFTQRDQKQWLNNLLHPLIQQETQRQFSETGSRTNAPYLVWVVPLLIENHLCHYANQILVVDVSEETQLRRIIARDNTSAQLAEHIMLAQTSRQTRLSYADDVLNNEGDIETLTPRIERLHQKYLALAHQFNNQDLPS